MSESSEIGFEDFQQVALAVGTIVEAWPNEKARVPAYILRIDFGADYGERRSSAQITERYSAEELVGHQVVAVMNFAPVRIAGVKSEVLVLGSYADDGAVVLLAPDEPITNGKPIG